MKASNYNLVINQGASFELPVTLLQQIVLTEAAPKTPPGQATTQIKVRPLSVLVPLGTVWRFTRSSNIDFTGQPITLSANLAAGAIAATVQRIEEFIPVGATAQGPPADLTGATAQAQLKTDYSSPAIASFSCTFTEPRTTGRLVVGLSTAQTTALRPHLTRADDDISYDVDQLLYPPLVWDLAITTNGTKKRVLQGLAIVSPGVTI